MRDWPWQFRHRRLWISACVKSEARAAVERRQLKYKTTATVVQRAIRSCGRSSRYHFLSKQTTCHRHYVNWPRKQGLRQTDSQPCERQPGGDSRDQEWTAAVAGAGAGVVAEAEGVCVSAWSFTVNVVPAPG
jgi:hypothetical protein